MLTQFTARFQGPGNSYRGSDKVWGYRKTRDGYMVFWGRTYCTLQMKAFTGTYSDLLRLERSKLAKGYRSCPSELVSNMLFAY